MILKLKNNIKDVEVLVEYRYINLIWIKIFKLVMSMIGVLAPIVITIDIIIKEPKVYSYIFMLSIFLLIMIGLTLFAIYLFFSLLPKLLIKRVKKFAADTYRNNKQFFLDEKIITIKDKYIEVIYNNKKLNIELGKNIFIDEFKGYIIITSGFMKNKITKVYPVIIPITIFESNEIKEEFIKSIEEKKMLL